MMQANELVAPNPGIATRFQTKRHWRGMGEPERSGCVRAP